MTEQPHLDKINNLDMRVTVLEVIQKETSKSIGNHEIIIDKLANQNTDMTLALHEISSKFDGLINQISVGSKIIAATFVLITTLVAAGWTYQTHIETRISQATSVSQQK